MGVLSFELGSVLISILVIMKFKFSQKFIIWLLKGVSIILPPNDKDYEMICDLKKGKVKNAPGNMIIRTCQVEEYTNVKKDENYSEVDMVVFFYLTSIFNSLLVHSFNFLKYFYPSNVTNSENNEKTTLTFEETDTAINVVASFVLITLSYLIFILFKGAFRNGYKSYDAKLFYILFICLYALSFSVFYFYENMIPFDYRNICAFVNDRLDIISRQAASHSEVPISQVDLKVCNKLALFSFYSFIFSFISALLFNSATRMSYFDFTLNTSAEKLENNRVENSATLSNMKKIKNYSKIRQVVNTLMLLLFIDPLLKNYLVLEGKYISEISYYLLIIFPLFICELALGVVLLRYYSTLLLNDNYHMMIDFSANPDKNFLPFLRRKMEILNSRFWSVFLQLFLMVFLNILIFILYLDRSDVTNFLGRYYNTTDDSQLLSNYKFKTNFIETAIYFFLLAVIFANAVFTNAYTFYLKNLSKNKKGLLI